MECGGGGWGGVGWVIPSVHPSDSINKLYWFFLCVFWWTKELCWVLFFFLEQGCQRVVEDWQKILKVRSLVLSPQEDMKSWLKYSSLCRKSGRLALSHKTLVMLLGTDPSKQVDQPLPTTYPQVTFAYMKHMWRENKQVGLFLVKRSS